MDKSKCSQSTVRFGKASADHDWIKVPSRADSRSGTNLLETDSLWLLLSGGVSRLIAVSQFKYS